MGGTARSRADEHETVRRGEPARARRDDRDRVGGAERQAGLVGLCVDGDGRGECPAHLTLSFGTRSYSPGTASGVMLWLPLGAAIIWRDNIHTCQRSLAIGLIIGIGVNVVVGVVTVTLGLGHLR